MWTKTAAELGQTRFISGAVTDGQQVYVSAITVTNGINQVLALNPTSGNLAWSTSIDPLDMALSAPSVGNGMVYVYEPGVYDYKSASYRGALTAMDAATGDKLFVARPFGKGSPASRPIVAGDQVFVVGGYYGGMEGYNATTGDSQWFASVYQSFGWTPAVDDDYVYVYQGYGAASPGPSTGALFVFDRDTGSSAFKIVNPDNTLRSSNTPVLLGSQNDAIVQSDGHGGTALIRFDIDQRSIRWVTDGFYGGPIALDNGCIFASNYTKLDVLDEATGLVVDSWTPPSNQTLAGNLLLTDNLIFAQTNRSTYAIDRLTLDTVWSTNTLGDLALGDGVLLISSWTTLSAFAVPEPSTLALLGIAILSPLAFTRRHRRRSREI